jgi:hypothetical protein
MGSYKIYNEDQPDTILYRAVGESKEQVIKLAEEGGLNLKGLTIKEENSNIQIKNEQISASIKTELIK